MVARPGVGRNPANGGVCRGRSPRSGMGLSAARDAGSLVSDTKKERPIVLRATTTLDDLKDELTGGLVLPGDPDDLFLAIHPIPARAT